MSLAAMAASAQIVSETFTYAHKNGKDLQVDVHYNPSVNVEGQRPVVMWVYGGGYNDGTRLAAANDWENFKKEFTDQGFVVIAPDYRLYFQIKKAELEAKGKTIEDAAEFYNCFNERGVEAMEWAVEDALDALGYVLTHDKWNMNRSLVVAGGGSAGACTTLTAAYRLCNEDPDAVARVPKDFRFAGIISNGGVILQKGPRILTWKHKPCPMMFYHGGSDPSVPYEGLEMIPDKAYAIGVEQIVQDFDRFRIPYFLMISEGADHIMAGLPQERNRGEMIDFIKNTVIKGERFVTKVIETPLDKPRGLIAYFAEKMNLSEEDVWKIIKDLNIGW